jgi:hypothetical protein
MAVYIGGSVNSRPSDQTDLKGWRRCNLGGDGEPSFEGKHDMCVPWAGRPQGGANRPHMSAPQGLLWWVAVQSVLESSHIGFLADKHDLL